MHKIANIVILVLLLIGLAAKAGARNQTIYVATNGDDRWSARPALPNVQGTDGPLRSVAAAVQESRKGRRSNGEETDILLRSGSYSLAEPLVLTGRDSGLVIAAWARIAGHHRANRDWRLDSNILESQYLADENPRGVARPGFP